MRYLTNGFPINYATDHYNILLMGLGCLVYMTVTAFLPRTMPAKSACVCVGGCVRACVRAGVRTYVRAWLCVRLCVRACVRAYLCVITKTVYMYAYGCV